MSEIAEQLQNIDLFKEVELDILEELVTHMQSETYAQGTVLFEVHDPGDTMYIIQEGRIRIYTHDHDDNEITMMHYGKNEIFGELSLIDQRPRSASASAAGDLKVLSLPRVDFLNFLNKRPQFGIAMMRSLSQRVRDAALYLQEHHPDPANLELTNPVETDADDLQSTELYSRLKADAKDKSKDRPADLKSPSGASKITGIFSRISSHLETSLHLTHHDDDNEDKQSD